MGRRGVAVDETKSLQETIGKPLESVLFSREEEKLSNQQYISLTRRLNNKLTNTT